MKYNRIIKQAVEAVQILDVEWDGLTFSEYPFSDKPVWLINLLSDKKLNPVMSDGGVLRWFLVDYSMYTNVSDYIVRDSFSRKLYVVEQEEFNQNFSLIESE